MEKEIRLLSNFLFILLDHCESIPEVAAEKTAIAIRDAFNLLYPKELNHIAIRQDSILKYCQFLRDSLDELIEETKNERNRTSRKLHKH